jgi:Protein of unknown function (DUF3168)
VIEVAIRQLLLADTATAAIVGSEGVYFITRPQDNRAPYIVLNNVSAVPGMIFGGRGGYVNGRMQITCLAPTYKTAKCIVKAARNCLDGYSGTQDGTIISYIETENTRDISVEPLIGEGAPPTYGVIVDAIYMTAEDSPSN